MLAFAWWMCLVGVVMRSFSCVPPLPVLFVWARVLVRPREGTRVGAGAVLPREPIDLVRPTLARLSPPTPITSKSTPRRPHTDPRLSPPPLPKSSLQGTKMVFAGIKSAGDRKDLIAYLKASTCVFFFQLLILSYFGVWRACSGRGGFWSLGCVVVIARLGASLGVACPPTCRCRRGVG